MTSYASDWPAQLHQDPAIHDFFQAFYEISDTPDAHEKYADQFTKDATLIMASKQVKGHSEILALRRGMWEKVAKRHHIPIKIFPFGSNADEVMLHGTVDYEMKDGRSVGLPWAARAHLVKQADSQVKMDYYQVYLDSAAQQPSK